MQNINFDNVLQSSFVRAVAQKVFTRNSFKNSEFTPVEAMAIAQALYTNREFVNQPHFEDLINEDVETVSIKLVDNSGESSIIKDVETVINTLPLKALRVAKLLDKKNNATKDLIKMFETKVKYTPLIKGDEFKPRFKRKGLSKLVEYCIEVQQENIFNVDVSMFNLAKAVFKDETIKDDEKYIMIACEELIALGNPETYSEFKPDDRFRMYQACCHGANGQSSDRSRALQNLVGVPTNYDIEKALNVVLDEMADMCSGDVMELFNHVKSNGSVNTIREAVKYKQAKQANKGYKAIAEMYPLSTKIKKPWSFVKACFILAELLKGNRPYIGMAFGLDAKCSGVQLGSLMTGDAGISAACGFTLEQLADAYERCIQLFIDNGFDVVSLGLDRNLIKKPFMGVFYGQGMLAFANGSMYGTKPKQHDPALLKVMLNLGCEIKPDHIATAELYELEPQLVANADTFHKLIEKSFGNMVKTRQLFKAVHGTYNRETMMIDYRCNNDKSVGHFMPDGAYIEMNRKVCVNINNVMTDMTNTYDIIVDGVTYEEFKLGCDKIDLAYQRRTGFVNLIQGTDALLARLIMANLKQAGTQHIIGVHDCFRVNICDMIDGKLHDAIQLAYKQIFTDLKCEWFVKSYDDLHEKDILGMYFRGVQAQYKEEFKDFEPQTQSQFTKSGIRRYQYVHGLKIDDLIDNLENKIKGVGKAYFFAK